MWPRALEVAIRRRTLDSILVAEIATGQYEAWQVRFVPRDFGAHRTQDRPKKSVPYNSLLPQNRSENSAQVRQKFFQNAMHPAVAREPCTSAGAGTGAVYVGVAVVVAIADAIAIAIAVVAAVPVIVAVAVASGSASVGTGASDGNSDGDANGRDNGDGKGDGTGDGDGASKGDGPGTDISRPPPLLLAPPHPP